MNQRTLNNDPRCAYTTRKGLFALLAQYRRWMAEAKSDVEMTARIRSGR